MDSFLDYTGVAGLILAIPLGLCLGSFATALASRIPAGKSWIFSSSMKPERSQCVHCGHALGVFDLVPFFSWLLLRGHCRYCQKAIGKRYPLTELFSMVLVVLAYMSWGFSLPGLLVILAVPFLLAMALIDLEHMILPDQLQLILAGLGVVFVFLTVQDVLTLKGATAVLSAVFIYAGSLYVLGLIISRLKKVSALGLGDVKFMAVSGLWLGFAALPVFFVLSGMAGVVIAIFWKLLTGKDRFPFGPALILSFFIVLCLQSPSGKLFFNTSLGL